MPETTSLTLRAGDDLSPIKKEPDGYLVLAEDADRGSHFNTELLDLEASGVEAAELEKVKKALRRFDDTNLKPLYDLGCNYETPTSKSFLAGEAGKYVDFKNPLHLFLPEELRSFYEFQKGLGSAFQSHVIRSRQKNYFDQIKSFEEFYLYFLNFIENGERRHEKYLGNSIRNKKNSPPNSSIQFYAERILFYEVLNILNNPSPHITPVGRIRALEMLSLFPTEDIAKAISSDRTSNNFFNAQPRLPHNFCTRAERQQPSHLYTWESNRHIPSALIKVGNSVDWGATASALVERYPEEAVQIALLMLHDQRYAAGAIDFLKSLPHLDRAAKSRIFGKRASFLVEHELGKGRDAEIMRNLGIQAHPGRVSVADLGLVRAELEQIITRKDRALEHAEEQLAEAQARLSEALWKIEVQRREIEALRRQPTSAASSFDHKNSMEEVDPKGYYRALCLHPQSFDGLEEKEIKELVKRMYRFRVGKLHPDTQGDSGTDEEIKLLNNAKDCFLDVNKRMAYGK